MRLVTPSERPRLRGLLLACLAAALATAVPAAARAAEPVSEQEAHAIGVEAYVYLYPLVTMDLTPQAVHQRRARQGVRPRPDEHVRQRSGVPAGDLKAVVRPNFDTLYSIAWLDLTKEPVIVSVPDTGGRYYLLPMLDMWTDVFASPGWRTTGTGEAPLRASCRRAGSGDAAGRDAADRRAHAVCLDHRPHQDRRAARLRRGAQDPGRLQGHAAVATGASRPSRSRSTIDPAST